MCSRCFADGEPLIVGTCIADGALQGLKREEIMAWLCLFIPDRSGKAEDPLPRDAAQPSSDLLATCAYADELAGQLDLDPPPRRLLLLALDWCLTKDAHRSLRRPDQASFVKSVMRILSYVDVVREVLLGLGEYATQCSALDAHGEFFALLGGGLVTNGMACTCGCTRSVFFCACYYRHNIERVRGWDRKTGFKIPSAQLNFHSTRDNW